MGGRRGETRAHTEMPTSPMKLKTPLTNACISLPTGMNHQPVLARNIMQLVHQRKASPIVIALVVKLSRVKSGVSRGSTQRAWATMTGDHRPSRKAKRELHSAIKTAKKKKKPPAALAVLHRHNAHTMIRKTRDP